MSLSYPVGACVSKAFALLTDPDFIVARSAAIGEPEAACEVELQGDKTVLLITRRIKRQNVPKVLSRLLNPVQTVNFVERWWPEGDDMVGEYVAEVVDLPIEITATLRLHALADGCEYVIGHTAKAGIPLIGPVLERFIVSQTGEGVEAEIRYLNRTLAEA